MRNLKFFTIPMLVVAMGIFGCSKNETAKTEAPVKETQVIEFSGQKFAVLSGDPLLVGNGSLTGDVKLIAITPRQEGEVNIQAETHLTGEKSEIHFFAYADKALNGGVEILFNTAVSAVEPIDALKFFVQSGAQRIEHDLNGATLTDRKASLGAEIHDHGHGHALVNGDEVVDFRFAPIETDAKYWGVQLSGGAEIESIHAIPGTPH